MKEVFSLLSILLKKWIRWWIALVLVTLLLGVWGYQIDTQSGFSNALYRTAQLFVLDYHGPDQPSWQLEIARWLAPLLSAFGVWRWAVSRLRRQLDQQALSNHVVVCGLGRKGTRFAGRFRQMGYTVVAIEADEDNPRIDACRNQNIRVLVGDATDEKVLAAARVEQAEKVLCLCGDSLEREADIVNEQIANQVEMRVVRSRPATKGALDQSFEAISAFNTSRVSAGEVLAKLL